MRLYSVERTRSVSWDPEHPVPRTRVPVRKKNAHTYAAFSASFASCQPCQLGGSKINFVRDAYKTIPYLQLIFQEMENAPYGQL